ncbi:head-tail adaptor protein [Rhizobium sp. CC-YZS058]|uniref:head-tail adaptor protein n=1 Tax=Rhizobium sp. CC-YZS058 TaxID=3042153 RepID=UPI002B058154|nr:head-tail adaptor protein [Rhizobium sp. CC-YZS058]MEA3534279.1 head-tail adaptor protein [Rhizobium sp. CC-YZS058]
MPVTAQDLRHVVAFDKLVDQPDGHGGTETAWTDEGAALKERAHFKYLRGGETALASRLANRQPVIITVRANVRTRGITAAWRVRDVKAGTVFAIRSVITTEDLRFVEITAETGLAVAP